MGIPRRRKVSYEVVGICFTCRRFLTSLRGIRSATNPMKTTRPSLKFFRPAVAAALAIAITYGFSARNAQAGYIVTLQQVGSDVVATGTGAIDLTDLDFVATGAYGTGMNPSAAVLRTGLGTASSDLYSPTSGFFIGPTSFGGGSGSGATLGTGDFVGINDASVLLWVPVGYGSGDPLSSSSTWSGATFASLGVATGTYEWTWGTGADQNFTLVIPAAAVPDPGSTFGLLLVSLIALISVSRFRSVRLA